MLAQMLNQDQFELKLKAGGYYIPVTFYVHGNKLRLNFPFNRPLLEEVKTQFEGRRWLGINETAPKMWEIPITQRNLFRLEVLSGKYASCNPYQKFDDAEKVDLRSKILEFVEQRNKRTKRKAKLYSHQLDLINSALATQSFVWAAEMGTGKTLSSIIVMEMSGVKEWLYIGPKSALVSVRLEFEKWDSAINPEFMTYEALRSLTEHWDRGKAPQGIIFDEASRLKNPASKRSLAAKHVADSMRKDWDGDCWIGELSGTPSPKSPADWWHLCEVACPGFIKEGHLKGFRARLAVIEQRETIPGAGAYEHILTWKDDDKKCGKCGELAEHPNHRTDGYLFGATSAFHEHIKSKNEVAALKQALRGLVTTKLKEDCLDLPAKRYKEIVCKPNRATINAAELITQSSRRAIEALTLLRELSDGFQYIEVPTGEKENCRVCDGVGEVIEYFNEADMSMTLDDDEIKEGVRYVWSQPTEEDDPEIFIPEIVEKIPIKVVEERQTCPCCKGKKIVDVTRRDIKEVDCPKDKVVLDLLEQHEEGGRLNIYAGFEGSINRLTKMCLQQKWAVLKADGKGWKAWDATGCPIQGKSDDLLKLYMYGQEDHPLMVFIGQPGAAGMGLTLTVSPTTVFFSNDFNGENRMQAEDRGHRIGMDTVNGGLIVDIIHLPSDRKVIENLKKKKDLQYMSMKGLLSD